MHESGKDSSKHARMPADRSWHAKVVPLLPQSSSFMHGAQNLPGSFHAPYLGTHALRAESHLPSKRQSPLILQVRAQWLSPAKATHTWPANSEQSRSVVQGAP